MLVQSPLHSIDVRGRFAWGLVFSKWRTLNYARGYVNPHNPRTQTQVLQRSYLSYMSRQWELLTQEDRDSWIDFAKTITKTNPLGQEYHPSGINIYVGYGAKNLQLGRVSELGPPGVPGPPALAGEFSCNPSDEVGAIDCEFEAMPDWPVDEIWTDGPLSNGEIPQASRYKWNGWADVGWDGVITAFNLIPGSRYGVRARIIDTWGRTGPYSYCIGIATLP